MINDLLYNKIFANKGIESLLLGISLQNIDQNIICNFVKEDLNETYILKNNSIWLYFNNITNNLYQIIVMNDFKGKFLDKISIGSTLKELETINGSYVEECDIYFLNNYPGIAFELEEIEDFDDERNIDELKINSISIYKPDVQKWIPKIL